MKNMTKAFGVLCLSFSSGLLLYWTMFLISNFLRVQRFGVELPSINFSTGIIGAVSVALFAFGIISVRSKTCRKLVLVRNAEGRVGSIINTEYASAHKKADVTTFNPRSAIEAPKIGKNHKTKHILAIAVLTAIVSSYAIMGLAMGTFSPIMAVSSISMQPTFNYGDLIVIRGGQAENVEIGDIIAFNAPPPYDKLAASPTVHRVVEKWTENEKVYFRTKGDANLSDDQWKLPAENVIGEYAEVKLPYLGTVAIFLKTPLGLSLLGLALASVFFYGYYKKKERR